MLLNIRIEEPFIFYKYIISYILYIYIRFELTVGSGVATDFRVSGGGRGHRVRGLGHDLKKD